MYVYEKKHKEETVISKFKKLNLCLIKITQTFARWI